MITTFASEMTYRATEFIVIVVLMNYESFVVRFDRENVEDVIVWL